MRGTVSFHAVDLGFFDRIVGPLTLGDKVNPEEFLARAIGLRRAEWFVKPYKHALERLLALLSPPPLPTEGSVWNKVRARLERLEYKPDPLAALIDGKVDPELHLQGRPYLILERAAERVSALIDDYAQATNDDQLESLVVEQLVRVHPDLARGLEPVELPERSADLSYRNDLLQSLKTIYTQTRAARGEPAAAPAATPSGRLPDDLAWRAVELHGRAYPFWIGRDVDGLEAVCRSSGVDPPSFLAPAWRPFSATIEAFPDFREQLTSDLERPRDVGAFVSPEDLPELLAFLNTEGSRMIQAAAREGVGTTCATLLRKIRECAHHAQRHEMGYLEASGILPPGFDPDPDVEEGEA
jgi:hypothetical protein